MVRSVDCLLLALFCVWPSQGPCRLVAHDILACACLSVCIQQHGASPYTRCRGQYEACYAVTSKLLLQDGYAPHVLALHAATACVLVKQAELFQLGHRLTEQLPDSALAWYTVSPVCFVG